VTLDFPFGAPLNALVRAAARGAASLGVDTSFLDSWRRAKLVLLDAGMAMRLTRECGWCGVVYCRVESLEVTLGGMKCQAGAAGCGDGHAPDA